MLSNYLRIILIAVIPANLAAQQPPEVAGAVRRVATTARLAAEEYRLGVSGGKVVLAPEVEEADLFFKEARRTAATLPAPQAAVVVEALDRLIGMVGRIAEPDSVRGLVERTVTQLSRELGVGLDETLAEPPDLARGEAIYRSTCASCHGTQGAGDGPAGRGLDPPAANLADSIALRQTSPLDFYRRVTIGIAGTAMPGYETSLVLADRWAVALYASTLRLPAAAGSVPASLRPFAVSSALSDAALLDSLGTSSLARVAAVRVAAGSAAVDYRPVFATVRRRLDSAGALAREGDAERARSLALDAYMSFEVVERGLRVKDPALVSRLEAAFAAMRDRTGEPGRLPAIREELARALDKAETRVAETSSPLALFAQSALILLREGLEAILVVGALIAFLVKLGAGHRRREIHAGVGAAIGLSVLTAVLIETVFRLSPAHQEMLEGITMAVAAGMLFWVSYWLVSRMEVARWSRFVQSRLSDALSRRSMFALASVAFLAVYREGFETVLFYKALALAGGGGRSTVPIVTGIVVAAAALALTYLAINRYGVKLPLRPFFAVTSGFLYLMAFIFAGKAIAELQEGGAVSSTAVDWVGRAPGLGIYPTIESLAAQGVLVLLAIVSLIWVFGVVPRRARVAVSAVTTTESAS
jgi:high-affinity iron transporter